LELETFSAIALGGVEHGVFTEKREGLFHFLAVAFAR
jgi:hypothetical protein